MLLSAVSVLVVAQSSSENPEGLMNNPVLDGKHKMGARFKGASAAAGLFGLRFRIPPGTRMSFSSEYCVLPDRGLCVGLSLVQRRPTECGGPN